MFKIMRREIKNYMKRPLFWIGIVVIFFGVFQSIGPYLRTHYILPDEEIANDLHDSVYAGEVFEGYVPSTEEQRRETWEKNVKEMLVLELQMDQTKAESIINEMKVMDIRKACKYLEEEYNYHGAIYTYEDSAYHKGSREEINSYLEGKLEQKSFSYYFARKFVDFSGLYMGFFATLMLSLLFMQDTRKNTYELLHTKPVSAEKYILGKVGGGFIVCFLALAILNLVFWILCCIFTKSSGFEVRLIDFLLSTCLYVLPNMLMIVCIYTLISLIFKNPLPAAPFLILYMVYSNMGSQNAEGIYGYFGRPLAIMVRFPGPFFDTALPPKVLLNQSFLILASMGIMIISIQLWKRRRI